MDRTLFDKNGEARAYLSTDYDQTIYLFDGTPSAYLYEERHIYGMNGRHLGWMINDIIYNNDGQRIAFTVSTCPVPTGKEPVKHEKMAKPQLRPRWAKTTPPNMGFDLASQDLNEFLMAGEVPPFSSAGEAGELKES